MKPNETKARKNIIFHTLRMIDPFVKSSKLIVWLVIGVAIGKYFDYCTTEFKATGELLSLTVCHQCPSWNVLFVQLNMDFLLRYKQI